MIAKTKEKEEEQKHQKHEHVGRRVKNKVTSSTLKREVRRILRLLAVRSTSDGGG